MRLGGDGGFARRCQICCSSPAPRLRVIIYPAGRETFTLLRIGPSAGGRDSRLLWIGQRTARPESATDPTTRSRSNSSEMAVSFGVGPSRVVSTRQVLEVRPGLNYLAYSRGRSYGPPNQYVAHHRIPYTNALEVSVENDTMCRVSQDKSCFQYRVVKYCYCHCLLPYD
jgi:hypothetical protein